MSIQRSPNSSTQSASDKRTLQVPTGKEFIAPPRNDDEKATISNNRKSTQHRAVKPAISSQQNISLLQEIPEDDSEIPTVVNKATVIQPQDNKKTTTVNNRKSTQHRAVKPATSSQQNKDRQQNVVSKHNQTNVSATRRERVIFQPEETEPDKSDAVVVAKESVVVRPEQIITLEETEIKPDDPDVSAITKDVAQPEQITTSEEAESENLNVSGVQNSAIVRYNSNLPSVREDEFLPPINRWTKFGGLFIVAVVALAIPISAATKYKETVKTQASVRPDGELRLVQAATEGRVVRIAVKNNQMVEQGDLIAAIDDSRLQTQKSQLQDSIQKSRSQLKQMDAQIKALNRQISAENARINSSVAATKSEFSRIQREYQDRRVINQAEVREAESDLKAATSALNAAQTKLNRYQSAAREGAISQDQLQEVQQAAEQQQQAVEAAQAKLTGSQTGLNPSDAEVKSATSRIAEARATGAASLATLNKEKQALIQRRIEINQQIDKDNKELEQTNTDLRQTNITATNNGIVSQLNLRNPGQIVRPGEQIAQIAPNNSKMVIKASVPAKSIGKLETGQSAQMRVSACPYSDYGTLKGTVTGIAPDTVAPNPEGSSNSSANAIANQQAGASFYEVAIEPNKTVLGKENNQCAIQLGMEGQADIITKEESVLQFLMRKARLTTNI